MTTVTPVNSSTVKHVGYDPENQILFVHFHSGSGYSYPGVSPDEHQALITAESVGKHLHQHVKSKYEGTKLDPLVTG
jgi:hypothetical protein